MLMLLSPAKTQDFSKGNNLENFSTPMFIDNAFFLAKELAKLSKAEISDLMNVSPSIAETNYKRYRSFNTPFNLKNAKQAILVYKGDVYKSMTTNTYSNEDFEFAQEHLLIISGLYGLLRPLDLIQAYRLEMDIDLETSNAKNIYEYWGDRLTQQINSILSEKKEKIVLNLASNEYFNAIKPDKLAGDLVKITFKENKNGEYKIIGILAKKARGMMADYIIKNRVIDLKNILKFDSAGYKYNNSLSNNVEIVFTR